MNEGGVGDARRRKLINYFLRMMHWIFWRNKN